MESDPSLTNFSFLPNLHEAAGSPISNLESHDLVIDIPFAATAYNISSNPNSFPPEKRASQESQYQYNTQHVYDGLETSVLSGNMGQHIEEYDAQQWQTAPHNVTAEPELKSRLPTNGYVPAQPYHNPSPIWPIDICSSELVPRQTMTSLPERSIALGSIEHHYRPTNYQNAQYLYVPFAVMAQTPQDITDAHGTSEGGYELQTPAYSTIQHTHQPNFSPPEEVLTYKQYTDWDGYSRDHVSPQPMALPTAHTVMEMNFTSGVTSPSSTLAQQDLMVSFPIGPEPPPSKHVRKAFTKEGKKKVRQVRSVGACWCCKARKVSVRSLPPGPTSQC